MTSFKAGLKGNARSSQWSTPKKVLDGNTFFFLALTQQIYLGCTKIERSHEIFLYSHPSFSLVTFSVYLPSCIYQITKKIKKNIFKLNEKITALGSLLVWLQSNRFINPLMLGQSKVLFHVFFPVFSYLT